MLTHTEKIAAVYGGVFLLACLVTWLFHWLVVAVWYWPLVGSEWRAELADRKARGHAWHDPIDLPGPALTILCPACDAGTSPQEACTCFLPGGLRAGEPDWDDEPSSDEDADQMIATWHGTADPTNARSAGHPGSDRATSQPDASLPPYASGEEHEQLADVHPIYLDLSDDPDLIVWDAKQQADRCWEIVHIEFPRLRAELSRMWEAAA